MKKVKSYLTNFLKKYQSKKYGVPYNIDKFWPYYHESLTKQMTKLGFELGTIQGNSNCGDPVCMLFVCCKIKTMNIFMLYQKYIN